MIKIKDRIYLGLLSGFIANIPKEALSELLYRKGIEKGRFANMAAGIFIPKKNALSKKGALFGLTHDFMLASGLGIPLVYLLSFTGKDKWLIKGLLTGGLGFGVFRGLMANVGPGKTYPKDPLSNISMTLGSLMWGAIASGIAISFGEQNLYNPNPLNKSEEPMIKNDRLVEK